MRAPLLLSLVAVAGLWGWALFWPKPADPLPERYRGEFVLYRFEPPKGKSMSNPYPPGQQRRFTFRKSGTYLLQVFVSGGYEMFRQEGIIQVGEGGLVSLAQVSDNKKEARMPPERYSPMWGQDGEGEFLRLTHDPGGHEIYLRRIR